ncbi:MAG: TetR/AcrR family transcriptional regulator [Limnobacter sp.]|nr:TetR/AcrR family transcriptional regulator [Limnobacter sp.]
MSEARDQHASRSQAESSSRAAQQRDRILGAAQRCFVEHGFHAASMARIAETAGMSPGLIYRYFHGKNEIILAIIERQLAERQEDIARLRGASGLVSGPVEAFEQWRDGNPGIFNAALFLEMSAEATRDPRIAGALREADLASRKSFRDWMSRSVEEGGLGMPEDMTETRAIILECLYEGLAIRAVREPDLDPDTLRKALAECLPLLLAH